MSPSPWFACVAFAFTTFLAIKAMRDAQRGRALLAASLWKWTTTHGHNCLTCYEESATALVAAGYQHPPAPVHCRREHLAS